MRERGSDSGIDIAHVFESDSPYAGGLGHGREVRIQELCTEIEEPQMGQNEHRREEK